MRSIFIKEISSFFSSVVGYIALVVFLAACGILFWLLPNPAFNIMEYGYASMERFFEWVPWLLLLIIPAITMRSFADEFRGGTIEWLSTKPLTPMDIIMGKYFAALLLVAFALLPTVVYVYSVNSLALTRQHLDPGALIGSYTGLLFLAASFTAVGVFCSSLASNQIVGFLLSLFACALLYAGFEGLSIIPAFVGHIDYYLSMAGAQFHYRSISRGLIDTRDIIYFLSVIILFLTMTRLSLASRTWDTTTAS